MGGRGGPPHSHLIHHTPSFIHHHASQVIQHIIQHTSDIIRETPYMTLQTPCVVHASYIKHHTACIIDDAPNTMHHTVHHNGGMVMVVCVCLCLLCPLLYVPLLFTPQCRPRSIPQREGGACVFWLYVSVPIVCTSWYILPMKPSGPS